MPFISIKGAYCSMNVQQNYDGYIIKNVCHRQAGHTFRIE
jgi:hypothetical protein